jgi:hypothetical protein
MFRMCRIRQMLPFLPIRRMLPFPLIRRMLSFPLILLTLRTQWIRRTRWRIPSVLETSSATGRR